MLKTTKLLQLALLSHFTSAQMINLLSSATATCNENNAYAVNLNDGGLLSTGNEYTVTSTYANSGTYCQFDMGSSQSVQSIYMH